MLSMKLWLNRNVTVDDSLTMDSNAPHFCVGFLLYRVDRLGMKKPPVEGAGRLKGGFERDEFVVQIFG